MALEIEPSLNVYINREGIRVMESEKAKRQDVVDRINADWIEVKREGWQVRLRIADIQAVEQETGSFIRLRFANTSCPVYADYETVVGAIWPSYPPQVILGDSCWESVGDAVQAYFENRERLIMDDVREAVETLRKVR